VTLSKCVLLGNQFDVLVGGRGRVVFNDTKSESPETTTPTETPTERRRDAGAAVSDGAIAGIAVGAFAAGVLTYIIAARLLRRRAKQQREAETEPERGFVLDLETSLV
jgi:hypothetical protein